MKIREYSLLIGGGSACLVLAIVAGVLLITTSREYRTVSSTLRSETGQLEDLRRRAPYPNESNVRQADTNLRELSDGFERMHGTLARGQSEFPTLEPAQWPLLRQRVFGVLSEAALQSNVTLPERFAYGFDRYVRNLPEGRHLPRLVQQVYYVEKMFRILLDSKVHAVQHVQRQLFEDDLSGEPSTDPWGGEAPAGRGRGRRTQAEAGAGAAHLLRPGYYEHPEGLYTRERMVFAFTVRESSLWQILDALTQTEVFSVVSRLQITNTTPRPGSEQDRGRPTASGGRRPMGSRGIEGPMMEEERPLSRIPGRGMADPRLPPPGPIPREERIAAGRDDLLNVELEIDFYRFQSEPRQEEARL